VRRSAEWGPRHSIQETSPLKKPTCGWGTEKEEGGFRRRPKKGGTKLVGAWIQRAETQKVKEEIIRKLPGKQKWATSGVQRELWSSTTRTTCDLTVGKGKTITKPGCERRFGGEGSDGRNKSPEKADIEKEAFKKNRRGEKRRSNRRFLKGTDGKRWREKQIVRRSQRIPGASKKGAPKMMSRGQDTTDA